MIYGKDLMGRAQAKKTLVDHLRREPSETPKFEPVNEAVLITLLTNQFNETFGDINESERAKLAGYLNLSGEELRKAMYEKRLSAREKLTSLSEEAEKDVKDKIIETLNEVETMETNRLNLYKLDNLLSDLG
jgi:predicted HTH transcriptional regulator